jgi:hypothetical protein
VSTHLRYLMTLTVIYRSDALNDEAVTANG